MEQITYCMGQQASVSKQIRQDGCRAIEMKKTTPNSNASSNNVIVSQVQNPGTNKNEEDPRRTE